MRWLLRWYRGEYLPFNEFYERHWTAHVAHAVVEFYLREWKWIFGAVIAIAAIAYKAHG